MLLSPKLHTKFLNANYGGFDAHLPAGGRPVAILHHDEATARSLESGDEVNVHNARGSITVQLEIGDAVQPGSVAVPFGWWHRHTPEGLGVNALTNPEVPADGIGSAAFLDTWVEVSAVET